MFTHHFTRLYVKDNETFTRGFQHITETEKQELVKIFDKNPDLFRSLQNPEIFISLYTKSQKKDHIHYHYLHENCQKSMEVVACIFETNTPADNSHLIPYLRTDLLIEDNKNVNVDDWKKLFEQCDKSLLDTYHFHKLLDSIHHNVDHRTQKSLWTGLKEDTNYPKNIHNHAETYIQILDASNEIFMQQMTEIARNPKDTPEEWKYMLDTYNLNQTQGYDRDYNSARVGYILYWMDGDVHQKREFLGLIVTDKRYEKIHEIAGNILTAMSQDDMRSLEKDIKEYSDEELSMLNFSELPANILAQFEEIDITKISPQQLQTANQDIVVRMTKQQIDQLTPDQWSALKKHMEVFSLTVLEGARAHGKLKEDVIYVVHKKRIQHSSFSGKDVCGEDMKHLTDRDIRGIPSWEIPNLSYDCIRSMNKEQITNMTSYQMKALTPGQILAFTGEQIHTFKLETFHNFAINDKMVYFSIEQLSHINRDIIE